MYQNRIVKPAGYFPREGLRAYSSWAPPAGYGFEGDAIPLRVGPVYAFESVGGEDPTPVELNTATTSLAWWRSDLGITPGAGGKAAAWQDQVHGYNPAQGTGAAQPVYNASDAGFGGHPSLTGNGTTQWLEETGGLATVLAGSDVPWELWIVLRAASVTADGVFAALCSTTTTDTHLSFIQNTTKWAQVRGAATLVNGGTPEINTTYLVQVRFSGTTVTVVVNGVAVITNQPLDAASLAFSRFLFFAQRQAAGSALSFFAGSIAEAYYCGYGTTTPVREALVAYFQSRYPGVA